MVSETVLPFANEAHTYINILQPPTLYQMFRYLYPTILVGFRVIVYSVNTNPEKARGRGKRAGSN